MPGSFIGIIQQRDRVTISPSASFHADTLNWQSRVNAKGGSVSSAIAAVDAFVQGIYADNLKSKILYCNVFATNAFAGLFEALWYPVGVQSEAINNGFNSAMYSLSTGLTNNSGAIAYATTGFIPSAHITLSNSQLSAYVRANVAAKTYECVLSSGTTAASEWSLYFGTPQTNSNQGYLAAYTFNEFNQGFGAVTQPGLMTGLRNSTQLQIWINGSLIGTRSAFNQGTVPTSELRIGCNGYLLDEFETRPIAFISAGQAMTASENAQYYSRVQALQTALGRAV